jgi:antitoxin MazE
MRVALRKMGNSQGVVLPKPVLAQIGAEPGGELDLTVEAGKVVIVALPKSRHPREGWAEASRAIAAYEDDDIDDSWIDFDDPVGP